MPNILLERKLKIPIYGVVVYLVVAEDLKAARSEQRMVELFGPPPKFEFNAACSYDTEGTFALFFTPGYLMPGNLAHEIYHLTRGILEWCNNGESGAKEQGAYLCEYLTDTVYSTLDEPWALSDTPLWHSGRLTDIPDELKRAVVALKKLVKEKG